MTEDEADKIAATMFDELVSTKIEDGKVTVETEVLSPDPKEVENAVADFVQSYRKFRENNSRPDAATDANLGMAWWKRLPYLAVADSRLKDIFCGPDRSPALSRSTASTDSR